MLLEEQEKLVKYALEIARIFSIKVGYGVFTENLLSPTTKGIDRPTSRSRTSEEPGNSGTLLV